MGNVQMILVLSIVYWVLVLPFALPFRLLRDPLALKSPRRGGWLKRSPATDILESMRKQG